MISMKTLKRILIGILVLILLVVIFFGVLTVCEYRPDPFEPLDISGDADTELQLGDTVNIVSWNIGYGSLDETADFFMDGGDRVKTADEDTTESNIATMSEWLKKGDYDIVALQEIDIDSNRSSGINEVDRVKGILKGYNSVFAYNFKSLFVPYPWPPIGKVESGIMTMSKYKIDAAHRESLPCPFSWPVRTCNLKRCLEICHIPIADSDKQLILINLHLEAFDDGEGKIEQTLKLLELLEEEAKEGNYIVAVGDFNQTFDNIDSSMYPVYPGTWQPGEIDSEEFGDKWQLLMDNSAPTCRSLDKPYAGADESTFQYYLIDGAIVSKNLNVKSIKTKNLNFVNSDHNPVTLKIEIPEK